MGKVHVALAVWLCACEPEAPADPTYNQDVGAILMANCVRCHTGAEDVSADAARDAGLNPIPSNFRLDLFASVGPDGLPMILDSDAGTNACETDVIDCGARDKASKMLERIDDSESPMPPSGLLPAWQRDTIRRWIAENNAPLGEPRGSPPSVVVSAPVMDRAIDLSVDVAYHAGDADADRVVVALGWRRVSPDQQSGTFAGAWLAGQRQVTLDTSRLATGVYRLTVTAWDATGSMTVGESPAMLTIGPRNVPPDVRVVDPNGGEFLTAGAFPAGYTIRWEASDPEGLPLTNVTVSYVRGGGAPTPICSAVPAGTTMCAWPLDGLADGSDYRIRVEASDGVNTSSDDSDGMFRFAGAVGYAADVAPILTSTCGGSMCHGGMMPKEGLDLSTAAKAYADLVDVTSSQCPSTKRVTPGSPSTSYVMWKLDGSGPCYVGSQMPKMGGLTSGERATIEAWIAAGALDD